MMNKQFIENAQVTQNIEITKNIFVMKLYVENHPEIFPGQFLNILTSNSTDPLLRRPISIADYENQTISIIYQIIGKGTQNLSQIKKDDQLNIIYPLGNKFPLPDNQYSNIYLVAGGIGLPPLLFYIKKYSRNSSQNKKLYYGAKNTDSLIKLHDFNNHLDQVNISTDEPGEYYHGLITDKFREDLKLYDQSKTLILSCGPEPMLKSLSKIVENYPNIDCYVSLEDYMACGYGVCNGCAREIKTPNGPVYKKTCTDGPIFNIKEVF